MLFNLINIQLYIVFIHFSHQTHLNTPTNGLILTAYGRNQHIYRLTDTGDRESAPFCVLYSETLSMLITCHRKIHNFLILMYYSLLYLYIIQYL